MSIEAVKQMVEALEYISSHYMSLPHSGCLALAAGRQAIAEAESQEPVAWAHWEPTGTDEEPTKLVVIYSPPDEHQKRIANWFPICDCAHPQPKREWISLTYEEYTKLWHKRNKDAHISEYGKAIDALLKEKNHG